MSSTAVVLHDPITAEIELRARTLVLYETIATLVELFRGRPLARITKRCFHTGFVELQVLEAVSVHYLLDDGTQVGRAKISVDWATYDVAVETPEGRYLLLNTSGSLIEQINHLFPVLAQHMERLVRAFRVYRRVLRVHFPDWVLRNEQTRAYYSKLLRIRHRDWIEWSDWGERDEHGNDLLAMETSSATLPELKLAIAHLRKRKQEG